MVYVDEQNLTDYRTNQTEERADKDKDVRGFGLPDPAELKNNIANPPAAIYFAVCCGSLCSLKRLKRAFRTQRPPIYLRSMGTRGEHVHQTFISLPPHVCTVRKDYYQHTRLRKHWARCVSVSHLRVFPAEGTS
jgi:hypothetical protein